MTSTKCLTFCRCIFKIFVIVTIIVFWSKFHWRLFLRDPLTMIEHMAWCFTRNKPSPDSVLFQIIAIYVFLGINELNLYCRCTSQLIYISSYQLPHIVNSLAPGKFGWNFRHIIFKQVLVIDGWGISSEIALIWMPLMISQHWFR